MAVALFAPSTLAERVARALEPEDASRDAVGSSWRCWPWRSPAAASKEVVDPGAPEPAKLDVLLDFFPNADHARIYAAKAGGHFEQLGAGREDPPARATPPPRSSRWRPGKVDLAISYEPEVLRARDKGLRVVSVAALVQEPLTSIMSLPRAGISRPADLKGKTRGHRRHRLPAGLPAPISPRRAWTPRRWSANVGFGLQPALISRRVDATLGGFWNYEGVELELKKRTPRIIRVNQAGVPALRRAGDRGQRGRPRARRARAPRVPRRAGPRHPRRAARPGAGHQAAAGGRRGPRPQAPAGLLQDDAAALLSRRAGSPTASRTPASGASFVAWMNENKLLRNTTDARGAYTNELLPGAGL